MPAASGASATPMPAGAAAALVDGVLGDAVVGSDAFDIPRHVAGDGGGGPQHRLARAWRPAPSRRWTARCGISRRGCSACRWSSCWARRARRSPIYGSGGFTSYDDERLTAQLARLGGERRLRRGQDEGRPRAGRAIPRGCRPHAIGHRRGRTLYRRQWRAIAASRRWRWPSSRRRPRRHLVRGAGLERRPRGLAPAARPRRRPAWTSPPANMATTRSISAACSKPAPSTCCRPTPTRCGGITGFLQAAAHRRRFTRCRSRRTPRRRCICTPPAPRRG